MTEKNVVKHPIMLYVRKTRVCIIKKSNKREPVIHSVGSKKTCVHLVTLLLL